MLFAELLIVFSKSLLLSSSVVPVNLAFSFLFQPEAFVKSELHVIAGSPEFCVRMFLVATLQCENLLLAAWVSINMEVWVHLCCNVLTRSLIVMKRRKIFAKHKIQGI